VAVASVAGYAGSLVAVFNADTMGYVLWTTVWAGFIVIGSGVGALLMVRARGNRVGPVLLGASALHAVVFVAGAVAFIAASLPGVPTWLVTVPVLINHAGFVVPIIIVLIGIPLIFPDGHLLSPRWRWLVVLTIAALIATTPANLVAPGRIGTFGIENPIGMDPVPPVVAALEATTNWMSIFLFGGAVLAVVVRYRRGGPVERQQLKWLIAVAAVAAVAFPLAFLVQEGMVSDLLLLVGLLALMALPIAIGVAILRYRLYEIDRIVSRTLGWALISGVLVTVFVGLVIGLQTVLEDVLNQGDTLAVAASTLVAFALFQPVRRRVQRAVDRRFDRARYDAERTAAAFAERLRDEVDLDSVEAGLTDLASRSLRPVSVGLWLRTAVHR
jgi:hypothetical protein